MAGERLSDGRVLGMYTIRLLSVTMRKPLLTIELVAHSCRHG
jgi:hypothetical protein